MNCRFVFKVTVATFLGVVLFLKSGVAPSAEIRCAIAGALQEAKFWSHLSHRFEEKTGHRVELVASGPRHELTAAVIDGRADLLAMHSCDPVINLVADGHAENPQPWVRNDFMLVGPTTDPADVRGMTDAVAALRKIIEAKSTLLISRSHGTSELLSELTAAGDLELNPDHTLLLPNERHREALARAATAGAYTLVGRNAFNRTQPLEGLETMVVGAPHLRRPFLVVVATPKDRDDQRYRAATELAKFLRAKETQAWIAEFRPDAGQNPIFFPVAVETTRLGMK